MRGATAIAPGSNRKKAGRFIDHDDIHAMNQNEDKEILESLAAAEK